MQACALVMMVVSWSLSGASTDFGQKVIADVQPSAKPELPIEFIKFENFSKSLKSRPYSTRYKSRESNGLDSLSQLTYDEGPLTSIVAPPVNFKPQIHEDDIEMLSDSDHQASEDQTQVDIERNSWPPSLERSDSVINNDDSGPHKRRVSSQAFRQRMRERLRQRQQKQAGQSNDGAVDASAPTKPAAAMRSRGRGSSTTSAKEDEQAGEQQEKLQPYQRLRSDSQRRGNGTFYAKHRGKERSPSSTTHSRGLRLRSRMTTSSTTPSNFLEATQIPISISTTLSTLEFNTEPVEIIKASPIDSLTMKLKGPVDEFVPASGPVKFEDIFSEFQSKIREGRITRRPQTSSQRNQVIAPEVPIVTVAIPTKVSSNQNVNSLTVTNHPTIPQPTVSKVSTSTSKTNIHPASRLRNTALSVGPSFPASGDTRQPLRYPKTVSNFIMKLSPHEIILNQEDYDRNECGTIDKDSDCGPNYGAVKTHILESTRDIIKQNENGSKEKVQLQPFREVTTSLFTRSTTPPPADSGHSRGNIRASESLYRNDVSSASAATGWHKRRPAVEQSGESSGVNGEKLKSPTPSIDFHASSSHRPAIFSTFDHFLKMHGVTESTFNAQTSQSDKSFPTAVSFQNSYMGDVGHLLLPEKNSEPFNPLSLNDHPNSIRSSKSAIALADLTHNKLGADYKIHDHDLFFRTPASLAKTTTTFAPPATVPRVKSQSPKNTRVSDLPFDYSPQYNNDIGNPFIQQYSHSDQTSINSHPNSLSLTKTENFIQEPSLPKATPLRTATLSAESFQQTKHRQYPVGGREDLHHQVSHSPVEPAFITHQKKVQTASFPEPNMVLRSQAGNSKQIPNTRTHFKAVLVEDGKDDTITFNHPTNFHKYSNVFHRDPFNGNRHQDITNSIIHVKPSNARPARLRPLPRNPRASVGRLPRGPNTQDNFRIPRPRNQGNIRLNGFMMPPPKRTKSRSNLKPRPIANNRNKINRIPDNFDHQESRDSNVIIPPPHRSPFIRTSQLNAGGHKLREKIKFTQNTMRPSGAPLSPNYSVILPQNHQPRYPQQRHELTLNSRLPTTSPPARLQLPSSLSVPGRNARHSPFKTHTNFNLNHPQTAPSQKIQAHVHKNSNYHSHHNSQTYPPTIKPNFTVYKNTFGPKSFTEPKSLPKPFDESTRQHNSFFHRQPTASSSHVYNVREDLEPKTHNDISLEAISQPLPHQMLLKTSHSKMAESHVSLLKNLQFGINGEPLDVWIPMKSDRTLKLVGRGQTPLLGRASLEPSNTVPIRVRHNLVARSAAEEDVMQTGESMSVPAYAVKDVLDGDKDFDYNDYDEVLDRQEEPQAASSTEEEVVDPKPVEESEDYADDEVEPRGDQDNVVQEDELEDDEADVLHEDDDE
ncbi:uncharacterized protein LOC108664536 [Hyalella azteca]|uniref:Uncharacterized protein LOC108664536 n=1 Tax=Hyalella azteca TaxID=294128 RepID=A0A8B7MYH8_HYAAZ|nr:uncharacterized protein LOC108664536 [Hyalella azteca]